MTTGIKPLLLVASLLAAGPSAFAAGIKYQCTLAKFHNGIGAGAVSGTYDIMSEDKPLHLTLDEAVADAEYTDGEPGIRGIALMVRRKDGDRLGGSTIIYEPVRHVIAYDFEFNAADHYNFDCERVD